MADIVAGIAKDTTTASIIRDLPATLPPISLNYDTRF